jgi:hypothetical protein
MVEDSEDMGRPIPNSFSKKLTCLDIELAGKGEGQGRREGRRSIECASQDSEIDQDALLVLLFFVDAEPLESLWSSLSWSEPMLVDSNPH